MTVTITREGVRISIPGQTGILLGFDAWDAFLHQVRKGWFAPEADQKGMPGSRITRWAQVHPNALLLNKAVTPTNDQAETVF
ncbi:hypothetical protein ACIBF6_24935 [Streptosporangium amethystogenes]|uniref:hypothetical protein n=1 Tax=Streptosporangium amethystogenes TaxID=2002 RepID=UPI0037961DB7